MRRNRVPEDYEQAGQCTYGAFVVQAARHRRGGNHATPDESFRAIIVVILLKDSLSLTELPISVPAPRSRSTTGDARRARRSFVELATDAQFGGLRYFASRQGMFNAEHIYQRAGGWNEALPFDWYAIQASSGDMRSDAFDAA